MIRLGICVSLFWKCLPPTFLFFNLGCMSRAVAKLNKRARKSMLPKRMRVGARWIRSRLINHGQERLERWLNTFLLKGKNLYEGINADSEVCSVSTPTNSLPIKPAWITRYIAPVFLVHFMIKFRFVVSRNNGLSKTAFMLFFSTQDKNETDTTFYFTRPPSRRPVYFPKRVKLLHYTCWNPSGD